MRVHFLVMSIMATPFVALGLDLTAFNSCIKTSNVTCPLDNILYPVTFVNGLEITGSNIVVEGLGSSSGLKRGASNVENLLRVSSSATNVHIRNLTFDGNSGLWTTDYWSLRSFLTQGNTQNYQDLKLNTATGVYIYNNTFKNSARYAVHFEGSSVTISHNAFAGGLDAAVRSHTNVGATLYNIQILNNDIRNYRAAGIALFRTDGAIVRDNHLFHNHFGDPYGADINGSLQGGGQIYLGAFARNSDIRNNRMDGAYWLGSGAMPPNSNYPIMNYGVEVDGLAEPGVNNVFTLNTLSNHGVSGYWIGGNNSNITLDRETVTYNRIAGVQVAQNFSASSAVKIKGSTIRYNEGWQWPNGANYPKWYGLLIENVITNGICIDAGSSLSPNAGGDQCQVSGSVCSLPVTSSYFASTCP